MSEQPKPNPGSDEALGQGCTCPVLDNGHGRHWDMAFAGWVYNMDCPLHKAVIVKESTHEHTEATTQ